MEPPQSLLAPTAPTVAPRTVADGAFLAGTPPPNYLRRCFLVFAPFCDQGLGVQARAYLYWLGRLGFQACVFACRPSKQSDRPQMQAAAAEWTPPAGVAVHYSQHTRETQPFEELLEFARAHGVTDALMLETAHQPIFRLAAALYGRNSVRVWAVPNIEMVRRSELCQRFWYDSEVFAGVLCHNEYTVAVFKYLRKSLTPRIKLLPFALPQREPACGGLEVRRSEPYDGWGPLRFLVVGGMNAVARKRADVVVRAFRALPAPLRAKATLTVLTQRPEPQLAALAAAKAASDEPPNVVVAQGHLTGQQILDAYGRHHVVVMLSRAEGIGIATYEAMRAGCAVVTLKQDMFTELIDPNLNGWLVPCHEEPVDVGKRCIGNSEPVVRTFTFKPESLQAALRHIIEHPAEVAQRQLGARRVYEVVYAEDRVAQAWQAALRINRDTGDAHHDPATQQQGLRAFAARRNLQQQQE